MRHDMLADVFCAIKNTESIGKKECVIPASGIIGNVLEIMHKNGYIGEFKHIKDGRGGIFKVHLLGKINDCNVVRPRFSVGKADFIKWEKRFLPANDVGILVLTTSKGVMDQREAKKKKTGGRLLGYVY